MNPFTKEVIAAAKKHALAEYPKESCGLVVDGRYVPSFNAAEDPTQTFVIPNQVLSRYVTGAFGPLQGIIHSHPDGPIYPTLDDMEYQLRTELPWAIISTNGETAGEPVCWGADLDVPDLLGREFVHGVADCYSIIRDTYRLGKTLLAERGIDWPYEPIQLAEVARMDGWWRKDFDLYQDNFAKFGFRPINMAEARPGDVWLIKLKSDKINHGGVLVGNNLVIHHLPGRLSRREPAGAWARSADLWLRYEGADA